MTTKILTSLIIAAGLAGSAAAALQVTDHPLTVPRVFAGRPAKTEPAPSRGSACFFVPPAGDRFAASSPGIKPWQPRTRCLTLQPSSAALRMERSLLRHEDEIARACFTFRTWEALYETRIGDDADLGELDCVFHANRSPNPR